VDTTILDDVHFKDAGLEDKDLYGYYATEDQCHFPQISGISSSINVLNIRTYSKYIWPSIPQIFGLTVLITINIQVALHPLFL
jgi:hypothetical protein